MRLTIEGVNILQEEDGLVHWITGARVDADGASGQNGGRPAYTPQNDGLDYLGNAGSPGNWYGIVTVNGRPYVQGQDDPCPGAYVSPTRYEHDGFDVTDPYRYVDSETVPYVVVNNPIRNGARGIVLGCQAQLTNLENGKIVSAVVADTGPKSKIGEISIAAAKALGLRSDPKDGGTERKIIKYELWPGVAAEVNGVTYRLIRA